MNIWAPHSFASHTSPGVDQIKEYPDFLLCSSCWDFRAFSRIILARQTDIFYKGQWRQFKGRRHWECLIGQIYGVQYPSKDNQLRVKVLTACIPPVHRGLPCCQVGCLLFPAEEMVTRRGKEQQKMQNGATWCTS